MKSLRNTIGVLCVPFISYNAQADSVGKLADKANNAAVVLQEVTNMKDHEIPVSLLNKATCVATFPQVVRAGFIFGARYGKGLVSCRMGDGWSNPSFVELAGGSWGLQAGIEAVDLVLVFVRPNAVEKFYQTNFTLGVNATIAIGPVGRDAQAGTDYQLNSEIYSYSRTRGLYAGLTLDGTILSVDHSANATIYGAEMKASSILTAKTYLTPETVWPYVNTLSNIVP